MVLNKFFLSLSEETIKDIAIYEYKHKTNVSFNSKIFNNENQIRF